MNFPPPRCYFIGLWALLTTLCTTQAQEPSPSERIAEWKTRFEQNDVQFKEARQQERDAGAAAYARALEELERRALGEIDFDRLVAARTEKTLVDWGKGAVPSHTPPSSEVASMRGVYAQTIQKSDVDYVQKLQALTGPYIRTLTQFEAHLTRSGDIDGAMLARAERVRVETLMSEITASRSESSGAQPVSPVQGQGVGGNNTSEPEFAPAPTPLPDVVRPVSTPSFALLLQHTMPKMRFFLNFDDPLPPSQRKFKDLAGYQIEVSAESVEFLARAKKNGGAIFNEAAQVTIHPSQALDKLNDFSVSFWFKTQSARGTFLEPVARTYSSEIDGTSYAPPAFSIALDSEGSVRFAVGRDVVRSRAKLNNNIWHHVLAVRGEREMSLYVDGESAGSQVYARAHPPASSRWVIGGQGYTIYGYSAKLRAQFDELVVFAATLSAQDAKSIYQSQR